MRRLLLFGITIVAFSSVLIGQQPPPPMPAPLFGPPGAGGRPGLPGMGMAPVVQPGAPAAPTDEQTLKSAALRSRAVDETTGGKPSHRPSPA